MLKDLDTFREKLSALNSEATLYYIPIKPSVKRWEMWSTMSKVNQAVEAEAENCSRLIYLDTATPLLNKNGTPDPKYFMKDGLHLKPEGYALWNAVVRKALKGEVIQGM